MLTVVYILCAVIFAFLIVNAVLVITLHHINNKFAKKHGDAVVSENSEDSDK
ncbi:MAG: hypothetical protein K2H30_03510 [Clostridia bacterium]|nr:hypothetical protein [Clostridia bacterium]